MKILFIGGTGAISGAVSQLIVQQGHELWLLNRGNRPLPQGAHSLVADINDLPTVRQKLADHTFDVVADFLAYGAAQIERDYQLFNGRTRQYVYISSASVYHKPPINWLITESTPQVNPYWQYAKDKIAGEQLAVQLYREKGFPVTIVRPSHTYSEGKVPLALGGAGGSWPVLKRMKEGKPVIIPGDGTALWTLTHSRDFAKGFAGLLGNPHAIGETVQITGDEAMTWNQVYRTVADTMGVELHAVHVPSDLLERTTPFGRGSLWGDKANCALFDNTKIKRLVPGFTATIRFDEGVRETVEYVFSHPECQTEDPVMDAWFDRVIAAQQAAEAAVLAAQSEA